MNILLVAPEVCPPWTEGRKKFVRDLAGELGRRDSVRLLSTRVAPEPLNLDIAHDSIHCRRKPCHLLAVLGRLRGVVREQRIDLICHFPYGTFRRHYGVANRWCMGLVDALCRRENKPCITVMYSVDDCVSLAGLAKTVSCLATGPLPGWTGAIVEPGIDFKAWVGDRAGGSQGRTLLFLAGMWQPNIERVEHVLSARGLGVLLCAGRRLAAAGFRLIAASPLFGDQNRRRHVSTHPGNQWPRGTMELRAVVPVPDIYRQADMFVFPYQREIRHFVPTSIVEAMATRTPVAMSDLALLRGLANGGLTGYLFKTDDPEALADTVIGAFRDDERRRTVAKQAQSYAFARWSIERSAQQVRDIAERLLAAG